MAQGPYIPPVISVALGEDDMYVLMAENHGFSAPAGTRLFRAEPHPQIAFTHYTLEDAEYAASILRDYLATCATGKQKEVVARRAGWWED